MIIRSQVLRRFFALLYGPLVFLHEPAGACLFGASWNGRREDALDLSHHDGLLLDAGCGDGRLLTHARARGYSCVGVEPSTKMIRHARKRGARVIQAQAGSLPLMNASVSSVVVTYPGPWIRQREVWNEFERVLQPNGRIVVVVGGTVERGRGSGLRSLAGRLVYGSPSQARVEFSPPLSTFTKLSGSFQVRGDRWGKVYRWCGQLAGN